MVPRSQLSTWLPTAPLMLQPAGAVSIDQSTPLPAGSGSFTVTPNAVPVPSAFEFDTMTVNPIWSPAATGVASAVLVIERSGGSTTTVASSCTDGAFDADAVAVLLYVPAL